MRGVDSNEQERPLCQRPVKKSSKDALVSLQRAQDKGVLHFPMHLRTRQNNTLDPAVQQHLEWLSFNWKKYFSYLHLIYMELFILGPINGKNGTLKSGKSKEWWDTKRKNDNDRFTLRLTSGNCWRAKRCRLLSKPTWVLIQFAVLRIPHIFSFWQFRVQTVATAMNATEGCAANTSPNAHTRTLSRCALHMWSYVWLKGLTILCVSGKVISSLVLSLLHVPSAPFPLVFSPSTTTPTPLTGIRPNPCATPLWGGPSGHLFGPTPNIGHEPKFCIDVSGEHTHDATIADSEDLNLPRHSRASSSSQHTLLKLRSSGTSSRRLIADCDSVASWTSIKETCAEMDRETVVSSLFESVSKGKRDRDQNVVQTLKDRQNLDKILEQIAELAVRGEKWLSKDHSKLR